MNDTLAFEVLRETKRWLKFATVACFTWNFLCDELPHQTGCRLRVDITLSTVAVTISTNGALFALVGCQTLSTEPDEFEEFASVYSRYSTRDLSALEYNLHQT